MDNNFISMLLVSVSRKIHVREVFYFMTDEVKNSQYYLSVYLK